MPFVRGLGQTLRDDADSWPSGSIEVASANDASVPLPAFGDALLRNGDEW